MAEKSGVWATALEPEPNKYCVGTDTAPGGSDRSPGDSGDLEAACTRGSWQ